MTDELPPGWAATTLGAVVQPPRSKASPINHPDLPFVGMDSIAPESLSLLETGRFGDMKSNGGLFHDGDVLYGRMRPYLNKVHRAQFSGACSAEFIVFPESEAIKPDFLAYLLHHKSFVNFASGLSAGDRPRVDFDGVSAYEFQLPPEPEQKRIVSKIDELFSRIDEGERALQQVSKLVERYRQSVLKAAVTGELTRDWREARKAACHPVESGETLLTRILTARREAWEQTELAKMQIKGIKPKNDAWKKKYPEPPKPSLGLNGLLPEEWAQPSLEQATRAERPIAYGVLQPGDDAPTGIPMVRVCDVANGVVDQSNLKRIAKNISSKFPRTLLQGGEVLLTLVGTIGRTAVVPDELAGANVARAVGVLSAVSDVLPEWLELCLRSEGARQVLTENSREVARKTLNLEQLREYAVPIPCLEEQREAVSRASELISKADVVVSTIEKQVNYASALRQSTLKTAFAGQLVSQDPNDESASVLLDRIADEPTITDAPKRGRKKKST